MTEPRRPADAAAQDRPAWRRFLPLVILLAAMAAAYAGGLHHYINIDDAVKKRDELKQLVAADQITALALYTLGYAASVALSVPGAALLTLLGGFLFGGILGGAVTVVAATLGAIIVFLAARSAFGETLQRRAGPALSKILSGFRDDAVSYLLFLRLVPAFPFWLVNLAAALGDIPLKVFAWTTFIGIIPGTFAFSVAGAGLDSVVAAQKSALYACKAAGRSDCAKRFDLMAVLTPELLVALALLGLVALIPIAWRRISKRRKAGQGGKT